jgi:hypothetical protein
MLLKDPDEAIRVAALRNPNLTVEHLAEYRADLLLRASRSRYPLGRAVALSQTELPERELHKVKHRTSPEWAVRYAVVVNPNTSQKVLEHLAQDGNRLVREKAAQRLRSTVERKTL